MYRVLSILVILAHASAISTSCFETSPRLVPRRMTAAASTPGHSSPVPARLQSDHARAAEVEGQHAHHSAGPSGVAGDRARQMAALDTREDDRHGHHGDPAAQVSAQHHPPSRSTEEASDEVAAGSAAVAEGEPEPALQQLRPRCPCGCDLVPAIPTSPQNAPGDVLNQGSPEFAWVWQETVQRVENIVRVMPVIALS